MSARHELRLEIAWWQKAVAWGACTFFMIAAVMAARVDWVSSLSRFMKLP